MSCVQYINHVWARVSANIGTSVLRVYEYPYKNVRAHERKRRGLVQVLGGTNRMSAYGTQNSVIRPMCGSYL